MTHRLLTGQLDAFKMHITSRQADYILESPFHDIEEHDLGRTQPYSVLERSKQPIAYLTIGFQRDLLHSSP